MSKIVRGKAMWLLVSVLVLLGLVALMQGGDNVQPAKAQPPSAPKFTKKVIVDNIALPEVKARLAKEGAILLGEESSDMGDNSLWRITDEQAATLVDQHELPIPGVSFVEGAEYTARDESLDNIPANLRQKKIDGYQLWRIKFAGPSPYYQQWGQILRQMGIKMIHSRLVWVTGVQIAQLEAMAASGQSFIEWTGPFHPAKRLQVGLLPKDQPYLAQEYVEAKFSFYRHPQVDETIARLKALAKPSPFNGSPIIDYVRITLSVPLGELENIAHWPDLFLIEPADDFTLFDEVQDQIVARDKVN